jgi:hypothetical protein
MKYWVIVTFFLTLSILFACKKDPIIQSQTSPITSTDPAPQPDNINYTNIPDTLVSESGTSQFSLDINEDNIMDFVIRASSSSFVWYNIHNSPFTITSHTTIIETLISGDSLFAIRFCSGDCSSTYSINTKIKDESQMYSATSIFIAGILYPYTTDPYNPPIGFSSNFTNDKFIGFQKMINGNKHFGWIRISGFGYSNSSVLVKDFAINNTPGHSILCGQMN